ncbi:HhH-GDP family DNA glycosylase [Marinitenerispora sediminis]|uniref:Endonuclease n=1 Tax=Marinitenerispora sediminis TaxID=1931232 RepID=A0A368T2K3_9ACTN|nr:endonuclease [Marinitenerispora sediminis]RCV49793.1 endonuclease [Marinitenerispora sediminis]RCV50209.1 endonuclease [Marinitenerispora sediminis]RCV55199.1 endonuclease [Marinitenerispora sediminis]
MTSQRRLARAVLDEAGRTLAQEAGVRLADRPAPLWQLLMLTNLLSARISARIALAAERELVAAGGTTPSGMRDLTWQQRVDALGRAHYVRYDESTATRLGDCARILLEDYRGDLRRLPSVERRDRGGLRRDVQRFPGIGPTGADIFCREAQAVWDWLRPYADRLVLRGAERVGLPADSEKLAGLVEPAETAAFAAGLVRAARDKEVAERVTAAAA